MFKTHQKSGLVRQVGLVLASILVLWVLRDRVAGIDFAAVWSIFLAISPVQWIIGLGLTAISLGAVARYDQLVAGYLGLPLPRKACVSAGWRATAIGQTLGFGLVTGALVRWRLLGGHGLTLWQATQMTMGTNATFFFGWAVVTSVLAVITPSLPDIVQNLGYAGLLISTGAIVLAFVPPAKLFCKIPGGLVAVKSVLLTAIDTATAAAIIYAFLPDGYAPFMLLYAAFMISLVSGMVSGLPGGVGPFELCMLALISPEDPAPLLAAMLAFRAIYYGAPALLAGASLLSPPKPVASAPNPRESDPKFHPPEAQLVGQGALSVSQASLTDVAVLHGQSQNTDIVLGDPFGAPHALQSGTDQAVRNLAEAAKDRCKTLCFYKIGPDFSDIVKRQSFSTHQIGQEAFINPAEFCLQTPTRRQLRRKLRAATKAKVTVQEGRCNWPEMEQLDAQWQSKNGNPRGFSMGRYSRDLIIKQRVFTAFLDGTPIAFISLNQGYQCWALDLIRSAHTCPDGTIHALVVAAIQAAKDDDVTSLSLSAAPLAGIDSPQTALEHLASQIYSRTPALKGLFQFKQCFSPTWEPRFMAASTQLGILWAALDLWRLINSPAINFTANKQEPHDHYSYYEIDSLLQPCKSEDRSPLPHHF